MTLTRPHPDDLLRIGPHPDRKGEFLIEARQWISRSPTELFPFYGDPLNLERITPPWLHFQVVTPQPIEMASGLFLDYRLRLRGIPLRWRSEISVWDPPYRFVDEQRLGPYRKWHHEHLFEPAGKGTTILDRVTYVPRGGRLINTLFVQPDLNRIFRFRQQKLAEIFAMKTL